MISRTLAGLHLYSAAAPAPNPRRVKLFLHAKRLELATTELSLMRGEHKSPDVVALNPRGQVPFLVLDDGRVLAETVAICRYLDELLPNRRCSAAMPLNVPRPTCGCGVSRRCWARRSRRSGSTATR